MKKIVLIISLIITTLLTNAQNKNMSVSLKGGVISVKDNDKLGYQISPQINYHFLKNKRANLTTSLFINSYAIQRKNYAIALFPDGTPYLEPYYEGIGNGFFGLGLSTQIKLFNLDKKLLPYIQPQITFQRELGVDQEIQTFGQMQGYDPPTNPNKIFNFVLTTGIEYNKKIQLGLYYDILLSKAKSNPTPNYSFGATFSYLFNISFKKKEAIKKDSKSE